MMVLREGVINGAHRLALQQQKTSYLFICSFRLFLVT